MKLTMTRVLTPLAALAFTLGAQATDFAKDDFEGQWSNATGGYSFTPGPDAAADATAQYTYDGDAPAAAISPIGGSTNLKGLKLSTEDGILFRNLTGANIGDGGLYVDTDVQFTLTDKSDRPAATADDKFIIWLEADEDAGTTNLCVWAREYALVNGALDYAAGSNKVYTLDASAVVPGSWHRLTVKAIKQSHTDDVKVPGFQVYLDNTLLTSSQQIVPDDDYSDAYDAIEAAGTPLLGLISGQLKFFPAMSASLATLAQVGFSGEGKIDDFVVSDNIPSSLPRVAVNVSFPSAVAYANLMGTAYTNSPAFLTLEPGQSFSFSMSDLLDANLEPLASYSFKLDEGALGDDWAIDGNIDGSYDDSEGTVTITAGNASPDIASFTIALERSTSATLTLELSGIQNYLDKIDTVSYVVGGETNTFSNLDLDDQLVITSLELDNVVTLLVNLLPNVAGVPVFTPSSGATGSGSTFTITDNSAEIAITLVEPVATVDGQPYTTFAEAVAAAKTAGEPVVLCDDIALEAAVAIAANETLTIDLNGNTITGADDLAAFTNAGTLTITDSSQDHDGGVVAGSNGYVVANTGTLVLEYGAYAGEFTNSGTFEITTDCVFDNDLDGAYDPEDGYVMAETSTGSGYYQLALVTYYITYMNGEQQVTGLTPASYTVEDNVTLPTTLPVAGVILTGWKDGEDNDVTDWLAGEMTGNLTLYAQTEPLVPVTPWYENPQAVVLAEGLPTQSAAKGPSAFHGQGQGGYLGLTFGTNPLRFDLYAVDGTNALTTLHSVAKADLPQDPVPGLRGVAISETLGKAMVLSYYGTNTMYTFPLSPLVGGNGQLAVTKPTTHAFDAAAFSPDGNYLFSNALAGESSNQYYVKWSVSADDNTGALSLTKVGSIDAGGRGRNLAYARINGRDIVFALVDAGKVVAIDMTGDTVANWTKVDLITDLPAHSYGSLCVSGVAAGALKLTVATSVNNDNSGDVLNVYDVTVPASGAITASLVKSFDQTAMAAAGFGTLGTAFYGNTVYVTDDNKTIYFARADCKLYAAEYVAPTPSGETLEPGEQSTATYESEAAAEAAAASVTIAASDAVSTALSGSTSDYLAMFEAKAVEIGSTGTYKVEVALTTAAEAELEDLATTNVAIAVAAQLPAIAASASGEEPSITVTGVVPGFYYSISYATAVNGTYTEGTRVLAGASGEITLQTPAKAAGATAGFYRVNVNLADFPPPTPNSGD